MKIIKTLFVVLLLLFSGLSAYSYYTYHYVEKELPGAVLQSLTSKVLDSAATQKQEIYKQKLLDDYLHYYNQNNDYVGWLSFDSGIISEAVMFSGDNDKYLRKDFYLNKDGKGTVFMDMDCTLDSRNITMYGHYVYYDENAKFSPLHLLKDEGNYETNKIITFKLKDEIRTYEVFAVYYYDWMNDVSYHYQTAEFQTEEGFLRHVRRAKDRSMYKTDVEIEGDDNLLTLQTCVRNRSDLRLIVVAKEID
ncbi:MAG: class B sortase [Erysipelotrichaceae bacterium]|nr:class B sortase [Erysipelotrichaceae bacterium]